MTNSRTAQLGSTASNVTVGKIGVSTHFLLKSSPTGLTSHPARSDDDDVRPSFEFCDTSL